MPKPWERRREESEQAYDAFRAFIAQPEPRSLDAVCKTVKKSYSIVSTWSHTHGWTDRARQWVSHEASVAQHAKDKVTARSAADWQRRRLKVCEDTFRLAEELRAKANEMLAVPLGETKWTLATTATMAKLAVELGFLATDAALAEDDGFDPLTATPEQCAEWVKEHFKRREDVATAAKEMGE